MRRCLGTALWMLALAAPLGAQVGREHFTPPPDTALDAEHAAQRDVFLVLRDSTASISAAGAKLMSDLTPTSSLVWMRSRARAVAAACARSQAPLASARVVTDGAVWPKDGQKKAQSELLKEMTTFSRDLTDCQERWTVMSADTSQTALREKAPHEMKKLNEKVDKFNLAARKYLQYISIKLPPPGTPIP